MSQDFRTFSSSALALFVSTLVSAACAEDPDVRPVKSADAQTRVQSPPVARPNPDSQYRLGPDSLPQEGVPKGEIRGPYTLPSQVYPGTQHTYWVYVPGAVRPGRPGRPHGLSGRPGVQGRERGHAGAERDGQPDLSARDPGHDRCVHQSRPAARSARADARGTGATGTPTGRPSTTRSTTGTRG